jgi:predicted aspartyl protease
MKRQALFCALVQIAILTASVAVPGSAESLHSVTVSTRPYKGALSVVAVKLNGAGPYDFIVDTGASVTVLDRALFEELGLSAAGSSRVATCAGTTNQTRSVVKEITLEGLSVQNITVVSMESQLKSPHDRAVRGILGENFLRHFDILFDNRHRTMTLDAADGLADSLAGEHLPIAFGQDENLYRPIVSVKLEIYGRARMLLDSGAAGLILFQGTEPTAFGDTRWTTVNGSLACKSEYNRVHLGKATLRDLPVANCPSAAVRPKDSVGILPTAIFKQIFISHAGSYIIIDPAERLVVSQRSLSSTPLFQ